MNTETIKSVGKKIAEGRQARGLNQGELAKELGKTKQSVSAWETGTTQIPLGELARVAEILNFPIQFFFATVGAPEIDVWQRLIPAFKQFIADSLRQYTVMQEDL